jgi:hypothetical protein
VTNDLFSETGMGHHVLIHLITLTAPWPTYVMTKVFVVLDKKSNKY